MALKKLANDLGLDLFSTPFDPTAVDFLETMEVPAYKIASFELLDIPLIQYVARCRKPIIMSTGMATLDEMDGALKAAAAAGAEEVALLKCTSEYPASVEDMNLRTIPDLAQRFKVPVGLSDHTLGGTVAVTAVALGACIVEKHFTISRAVPGPDSAFSMEPAEFKNMVEQIRTAEKALGRVNHEPVTDEKQMLRFRRSLFVVADIRAGELFSEKNIRAIRPGMGLPPGTISDVLGKKASRDLARGTPLKWDDIQGVTPRTK
jgi:N-acetylneuraminate synthase